MKITKGKYIKEMIKHVGLYNVLTEEIFYDLYRGFKLSEEDKKLIKDLLGIPPYQEIYTTIEIIDLMKEKRNIRDVKIRGERRTCLCEVKSKDLLEKKTIEVEDFGVLNRLKELNILNTISIKDIIDVIRDEIESGNLKWENLKKRDDFMIFWYEK